MIHRPFMPVLLALTLLAGGITYGAPRARAENQPAAEAQPSERNRGRIEKAEAAALLKEVDVAMQARDSRALADLLAAKFEARILVERDGGGPDVTERSRAEYIEDLRTRWAGAIDYSYDRRNEIVGTYPSGRVALVRSDVSEQFESEDGKTRTVTHQTVTIEVVGNRLLITKLTGFTKPTPPLF